MTAPGPDVAAWLGEIERLHAEAPAICMDDTADLINAVPRLVAAVRAVAELADELDEDSRSALVQADVAHSRNDTEVRRIYVRHARVAKHASSAIRGALTAALSGEARQEGR